MTPVLLLVITAASHTQLYITLLVVCHLEGSIIKVAHGHNVLLHHADKQHDLILFSYRELARWRPEGIWIALTYYVMQVSCTPISFALGCRLLAESASPKNVLMGHILRINSLYQHINSGEQAGHQCTTAGSLKTIH